MSFVKKALTGLLGGSILGLFKGSKRKPIALPRPATRDDAAIEAAREQELARRRGAQFDRIPGASGEPVGGLGRMIIGS
jgi:hypothetical protein